MKADEKRFHRIRLLSQLYLKYNKNEQVVIDRAKKMGVTEITAKSYLNTIRSRYG